MTPNQFERITKWQKETFGQSTALSKISHLYEELIELVDDIESNRLSKKLEFADCFILLFGAASADGMTYSDIVDAIDEKMSINYKRKWGKPNENGVVNHIKTDNHE